MPVAQLVAVGRNSYNCGRLGSIHKVSTISPIRAVIVYDTCMENFTYTFTESEDQILTEMVAFFIDCGLTSEMDSDAFDTLSEKVLS